MALPNKIDSATPLGSDSPNTIDDQIRALKLALIDILGIPNNTNVAAATMEITATGLKNLRFQDAAADPATAGYVQRNGANLVWHNGTSAEVLLNSSTALTRGHIWRLWNSNQSGYVADTANDVYVTTGECASDDATATARVLLQNPSAMIKQIDAVWAAGDNAGGRISTEALVNGTWHLYMFRRSGGATDFCFSQSLTPTLPDGGTKKRRIVSLVRSGGVNTNYLAEGDWVFYTNSILDVNANNPGTSAVTRTLTIPTGIVVEALFSASLVATGTDSIAYFSPLTVSDVAPSYLAAPLGHMYASPVSPGMAGWLRVHTNTSAQIRSRLSASDVNTTLRIATWGFVDQRDRSY